MYISMRFIIPKGKKISDSLELLSAFLKNSYGDYPFASGNINIYLNVAGKSCLPESENNKEFTMDNSGNFVDSDKVLIQEAFQDTFWRIDGFIKDYSNKIVFLQDKLHMLESRKAEYLKSHDDSEQVEKAWDYKIASTKAEIGEAFFLEDLAAQLKQMRAEGRFVRYSRVSSYQGGRMSGEKTFKDVTAVVEFNDLERLDFTSCFFMNGRNEFIKGKFDKERQKNRMF